MLSTTPVDLNKVDKKNIDKELLRVSIIGELDTVNLYKQALLCSDAKRSDSSSNIRYCQRRKN
ncbi:MAG: hypothetical protein LUQ34_01560, partial [Euryarchaeota archaeon]|nr:hypothetical protein [Euryarchaeota archaeon]